jgi:hypothetical protein
MCPVVPVRSASQNVPIEVPDGRSNSTRQPLIVVVVPLVMVYFPSYPVSQLEVRENVAVADAASAGRATSITAPTVTVAAATATKRRNGFIEGPTFIDG